MSVSALAKLASGTAETYRRAHGFMNAAGVTNVLPSSWLLLTRAKLGLYEGLTCLNQAKVVATGSGVGKYGLEIAWLRGALDAFTKVHVEVFNGSDNIALRFLKGIAGVMDVANSDSEVSESLKKVKLDVIVNMEAVKQLLTLAEKDNDVVYMEVVPPLATLLCPTAAVMVKPDLAPLYDIYITNKLPPLFQTLTPLYIRQSQERYTKARTEYLQPLAELSNATTSCRADLAAANLPTSIESLSKPDSQILHEMHAAVAGLSNPPGASLAETLYGARAALLAKRDVVQTLLKRAGEALDAEAAMDAEARQAFAGRWTRLESAQLTKGLREAVRGYADKLDAAAASDAVVLGKVDGNGERLALLGDENLLKVLIRGGGGGGAEAGGGVSEEAMRVEEVIKLKGALALLNEVISKRDKLCADVDALIAVDDITPKLLEASNGVFINNEQDIYAASLQKYEPFVAMSRASQKSQNDIVTLIKSRNAKFVDWTKTNERLAKRNEFVADHARGIEMFKEIMSNFAAGLAFYSQFEPILNKFLVNCQDYCMTRGIEKADLLEELQRTSLQSQPQYDPNNINFSFNPNPPPSVPPPFRNP
ncbi:ALIX V-shaped domain binding to HIV-domain-containing protein [Chytriomyces sp. MP71]|nr:ALIX V-shaped domain binding to HIV-domain-containing protein [Chytriomyces sp. MP71]